MEISSTSTQIGHFLTAEGFAGWKREWKEEVQWRNLAASVLGSCDSDLIERNGGLMLNGREEARGCLQRVMENKTGRKYFRVSST